jgi:diguanylate cyclase (GGDEF)-like protein/PAS domain S-box-containing protein
VYRLIPALLFSLLITPSAALLAADLRVGIDNNPPLTFINEQSRAAGLFPDLINRIAEQRNWTVEYVPCRWQQCLQLLSTAEIDVIPAIAYTEERARDYHYAKETLINSWGHVYQRPGQRFDSILALAGKRLAVLEEDVYYVGEQGLRQLAKNFDITIEYVEVSTYRAAFRLLRDGQVDAALVGRVFGILQHQEFQLIPAPIMVKPIQVRPAFSSATDERFVTEFDETINTWKQSPDSPFYQLHEKWLGIGPPQGLPSWLTRLLHSLAGGIALLLVALLWIRRQVKSKTRELDDKNRLLEKELRERSQIEQELRERQQQYQVFFEESHSVMLLVDPENAAIVDANPAACRFYQYPREQLQQMKMWQINRLEENQALPPLKKVKRQKNQKFEFVHMRADGSEIPVEVYRSPIAVQGRTLLHAIVHDISQRKEAERALQQRHYFLQSVIDGVSDPLMVIGLDHKILTMNQAAANLSQNGLSKVDDITCHQLSHASLVPCDGKEHPCPLSEVYATHSPVTMIHQHTSEQGPRIVELTASPLFSNSGELYAIIEVVRDITERLQFEELLNENEKRLHHLAHHDVLTGLPNRLLFDDRLKQAISKAKRSGKQAALFFLDLDHLKTVNDTLGHDYGDRLLVEVAQRLGKAVRESDTIARLGGDEFLILLEEVESIAMIETMAQRISDALNHELKKENFILQVSSSIGISIFPGDASSGEEMMINADKAMYRVKQAGKDSYQFYADPQGLFQFD